MQPWGGLFLVLPPLHGELDGGSAMKSKRLGTRKKPTAKRAAKKSATKKRAAAKRTTRKVTKVAKAAKARRRPKAAAKGAPPQRQRIAAAMTEAATPLTVKEALEIAIGFENKVRDHYSKGAQAIQDPQGSKVFAALAKEEQGHVDYLAGQLGQLTTTGSLGEHKLKSILPTPEWVREAEAKHRQTASGRRIAEQNELELLKIALQLEDEASTFYHDLVRRLPEGDRPLFEQFLDIEDGHLAIVQSELDAVTGLGFWFDVPEFALEAQ
jgi:rubrerythrin